MACHSETIADAIKKKIPNAVVIAIYNKLPVLDKAGTDFVREFYDKIV